MLGSLEQREAATLSGQDRRGEIGGPPGIVSSEWQGLSLRFVGTQ